MVINVIGAIFFLGLCIFIHELGHLLMGMLVGAKAKVFSMGYGKGIWKKEYKGTTYQITAIPLGGYVQFYGHDYQNPDNEEAHVEGSFMSLSPLKRIVPVIGGPLFNLILGALIYFLIASIDGIRYVPNEIVVDNKDFPAYKAGLKTGDAILAVNGTPTETFSDIRMQIALSDPDLPLKLKIDRDGKEIQKDVTLKLTAQGKIPQLGIASQTEDYQVVVYMKNAAAKMQEAAAPFKHEDEIMSVNGKPVTRSEQFIKYMNANRGKQVDISVKRTGGIFTPWAEENLVIQRYVHPSQQITFTEIIDLDFPSIQSVNQLSYLENEPGSDRWSSVISTLSIDGKTFKSMSGVRKYLAKYAGKRVPEIKIGGTRFSAKVTFADRGLALLSIGEYRRPVMAVKHGSFGDKLGYTGDKISQVITGTFRGLGLLIAGRLSASDNLHGPLSIAQNAARAVEMGFRTFFEFMAYISIVLMFMNLLPLPIVDGGHIVFFLIEAIRGRPLPASVMDTIMRVGFLFLLALGAFVMFNDILRF